MKSRLKQRIFALSLLAWTAVCPADAQQTRSLRDQFLSPSDEAKPWTFWYWMYGVRGEKRCVSKFGRSENI